MAEMLISPSKERATNRLVFFMLYFKAKERLPWQSESEWDKDESTSFEEQYLIWSGSKPGTQYPKKEEVSSSCSSLFTCEVSSSVETVSSIPVSKEYHRCIASPPDPNNGKFEGPLVVKIVD